MAPYHGVYSTLHVGFIKITDAYCDSIFRDSSRAIQYHDVYGALHVEIPRRVRTRIFPDRERVRLRTNNGILTLI